jgi:hypothetical protein
MDRDILMATFPLKAVPADAPYNFQSLPNGMWFTCNACVQ